MRIRRIIPATKERVFRAWTEPAQLKRWWSIGEGWRTLFAEIDLRVGGKFALGNKPPDADMLLITGEFLVVDPPDKLAYTWRFQGTNPEENIITVEFHGRGEKTEVVVTHEQSSKEMGPSALAGWRAALESLCLFLG